MTVPEIMRLAAAVSLGALIILALMLLANSAARMTRTGKWARAYDAPDTFDHASRPCAYVITYREFLDRFADGAGWACHDFKPHGFLFDEQGVYGFPDCVVGFASPEDEAMYRAWCETNDMF